MRSPFLRCLLVAVITTFGVYVVASRWGRPFEHDRAAAEAWTWAFSRLAWTPAALGVVAGCLAFAVFVLAQLFGVRPREAFVGALAPYPVVLLVEAAVTGHHALLAEEALTHGAYLAVPAAAWMAANLPAPGPVVEVDGRPITRDGNAQRIGAALRNALRDGGNVVVERFRSPQFVQFRVAPPAGLVLDLPRAALDDEQWARARQLLEPLGAVVTGDEPVLELDLAGDIPRGAELALRVFADVYEAGDAVELTAQVV